MKTGDGLVTKDKLPIDVENVVYLVKLALNSSDISLPISSTASFLHRIVKYPLSLSFAVFAFLNSV
jgi:hypothetical protein